MHGLVCACGLASTGSRGDSESRALRNVNWERRNASVTVSTMVRARWKARACLLLRLRLRGWTALDSRSVYRLRRARSPSPCDGMCDVVLNIHARSLCVSGEVRPLDACLGQKLVAWSQDLRSAVRVVCLFKR